MDTDDCTHKLESLEEKTGRLVKEGSKHKLEIGNLTRKLKMLKSTANEYIEELKKEIKKAWVKKSLKSKMSKSYKND